MRRFFRVLAIATLAGAVAWWAAKGANLGWTINNLAHSTTDPVTGLSAVSYEKVFVPGFDFLLAAGIVAAGLFGISCLFSKPAPRTELTGTGPGES